MKNIDLPLEIRTKKKNERIDIKEVEHERGGKYGEEKKVRKRKRKIEKGRDEEKERWPL